MKNKLLLIGAVLFGCSIGYGQTSYYWSGGKRISLTTDSSHLIVRPRDSGYFQKVKSDLISEGAGSISEVNIGSEKVIDIKIKPGDYKKLQDKIKESIRPELTSPLFTGANIEFYFTNEIIVKPKKGVVINNLLNDFKRSVRIKSSTKYSTFLLETNSIKDAIEVANKIYESGLVEWCHPNFLAPIVKWLTPADALYTTQYNLNNTGQSGGTAGIDINAPEAWDITTGCNSTRVVVIDEGVEAHEDLTGRVLTGFTPRTAGNGTPTGTGDGHGQACSGIIAATHNTIGISGIAPNSLIIPVNIFSGGETAADLANGINWAWDPAFGNADVINCSWGFNTTSVVSDAIVDAIEDAMANGRVINGTARGSVVVFASGNSHQSFSGVTFPANVDGVITVGAISNQGNLWNYSSRGPEMDLVVPSGDINLSGNLPSIDRMGTNGYETGNYTDRFGGTSGAAPQVSGVAALIVSVNPNITVAQVLTVLQQTATDMGTSGFDNDFGSGRVNAEAALKRVISDLAISINGASIICTSQVYQVNNLPAGNTVTWSSIWAGAPYPTLAQNTPSTNQCTITNTYQYPTQAPLTAIINSGCGNFRVNKLIMSDYYSQVQYGTYTQEGCSVNNVWQSELSGDLPYTTNTPTYLHQVCMAQIVLLSMVGKTVSLNAGSGTPQYWDYNSSNNTLSFQIPYLSGGIPFSFRITGDGACQEKTILFFGYLDTGFRFAIAPNPSSETLTIYPTVDELAVDQKESRPDKKELEYTVSIRDLSTGELVLQAVKFQGDVSQQINVSKLRKGFYDVQITVGDETQSIRFLKEE